MERLRKPLQGVTNIIRFNWHFYILAICFILALCLSLRYVNQPYHFYVSILILLVTGSITLSLLVSLYVYDLSGLYQFKWIDRYTKGKLIININAGFDETSALLQQKFNHAEIMALDFYDPEKHTEISIKRARAAYPPFTGTKKISTTAIPLRDNSADTIFITFAAHEIRNETERIAFFKELKRVLKPNGKVIITEHLRDPVNFIAYNIGFFHFYSKKTWHSVFNTAQLTITKEIKPNPFISTFILEKNGDTL